MSLTLCLSLVILQLVTSSEASAYPPRSPCRGQGCRHLCFLRQGLPQCSCFSGFRLLSDNRSCVDEDECRGGSHLCEHACVNTPGYYMCGCHQGFALRDDGRTCRPVGRYEDSSCQDGQSPQVHVPVETSPPSVTSLPDLMGLPCREEFCGQEGDNPANSELEWSPWMPVDGNLDPELLRTLRGEGRRTRTRDTHRSDVTENARMLADSAGDNMPARGRHRYGGDHLYVASQPSEDVIEGGSRDSTVAWRRRGGSSLAEVVGRWRSELRARKVKVRRRRAIGNDVTEQTAWNHERFTEKGNGTERKRMDENVGRKVSEERKMAQVDPNRRGSTEDGETEKKKSETVEFREREKMQEETKKTKVAGREERKSKDKEENKKVDTNKERLPRYEAPSSSEGKLPSIDTSTTPPRSGDVTEGTPSLHAPLSDHTPLLSLEGEVQGDQGWGCRGDLCGQPERQEREGLTTSSYSRGQLEEGSCPPGFMAVIRDTVLLCQPASSSEAPPQSSPPCGQGQEFDPELSTCVPVCDVSQVAMETTRGWICVGDPSSPLPQCPPGQVLRMTLLGRFRCDPIPSTTASPTTTATTVTTTATTSTTTTATTTTATTTTATTTSPTTTTATTTPPTTTTATTTTPTTDTTPPLCEDWEVEVLTTYGRSCVPRTTTPPPTPPTTPPPPCPLGLELQVTAVGVVCRFPSPSPSPRPCPPGQIRVETGAGPLCVFPPGANLPRCAPGQVLVETPGGYECRAADRVTSRDAPCPLGQELVVGREGLECHHRKPPTLPPPSPLPPTPPPPTRCPPGWVLLVEMQGERGHCRKLQRHVTLCGEGHRPVVSRDGFVCRPLSVTPQCPPGFHPDPLPSPHPRCVPRVGPPCTGSQPCPPPEKTDTQCGEGYEATPDGKCRLATWLEVKCHGDCQLLPVGTCAGGRTCSDAIWRAKTASCLPSCANGGTCQDSRCLCPPGVTGPACLQDVDECQTSEGQDCQHGCRNTFGSFHCACPEGHTLNADRRTCKAIECVPACLNGGVCVNSRCVCPPGLTGALCQTDIDECAEGGAGCQSLCRNSYGSFACLCPPGFSLAPDRRSCINNTCPHTCRNGGLCRGQRCVCPSGFTGIVCQLDENECRDKQPCSHICVNTRGSFHCACPPDLVMSGDGVTCVARHDLSPRGLK